MARALRPWNAPDLAELARPLRPGARDLHDALMHWGALFEPEALELAPAHELDAGVACDEFYRHPTPFGDAIVLGPTGRARVRHDHAEQIASGALRGFHPRSRPSTHRVINAAYMARCISQLTADGTHEYLGRRRARRAHAGELREVTRDHLHEVRDDDGVIHLVVGQARGYSARSLRRMLAEFRVELARAGGRLIIFTPDLRRGGAARSRHHYLTQVVRCGLDLQPPGVPATATRVRRGAPGTPRRTRQLPDRAALAPLDDTQWSAVRALVCAGSRDTEAALRASLEGVRWKLHHGRHWREIPVAHGHWKACYTRHQRWTRDGTWTEIEALTTTPARRP